MMNKMNSLIRSEEGQGMTEYIIIVALIAIAAIAVVTLFGNNLRILFTNSANALGGNETANLTGQKTATVKRKGLGNFGASNNSTSQL